MRKTNLLVPLILAGGLFSCAQQEPTLPPSISTPTATAVAVSLAPPTPSPAAKVPQPERLDSKYPLPPLQPALSDVPGVQVVDWGYRFTRPGLPENSLLIQATVKNESDSQREVLVATGLQHGVPWALPGPVWYRVDMQEVQLEPGEERTINVEFPELQNIHIGIKSKFYDPRVLVKEPADFSDGSNAVRGVKILEWNYTVVARPRGPHPAKFVAVIRNLDSAPKRVVLRTELIPKPDVEGYDGPPEGFSEDHVIEIPEAESLYLAQMPMMSTSGIGRHLAPAIFDAGVHIVSVEAP
jgi:hypothetical protein